MDWQVYGPSKGNVACSPLRTSLTHSTALRCIPAAEDMQAAASFPRSLTNDLAHKKQVPREIIVLVFCACPSTAGVFLAVEQSLIPHTRNGTKKALSFRYDYTSTRGFTGGNCII